MKRNLPLRILACILVFIIGFVGSYAFNTFMAEKPRDESTIISGELQFHFPELGMYNTGDCTLVKVGDTEVLIDAGSKVGSINTVDDYIRSVCTDGVLEYVIVTHAHEDHYACFTTNDSLFNRYKIGTIIDFAQTNQKDTATLYNNYKRERQEAIDAGAKHLTAKECRENNEYEYDLSPSVKMTILDSKYYYEKDSEGENNHSVCTLFTQGDRNFLFTGDLEKKGEKELIARNTLPEVDLYKAGHHGSKTSSCDEFLAVIKPDIVCVCCCAGNSEYTPTDANKFPTQQFVDSVSVYTDKVYVTTRVDDDSNKTFKSANGNILVRSTSSGLKVECSASDLKMKDSDWFIDMCKLSGRSMPDAWAV